MGLENDWHEGYFHSGVSFFGGGSKTEREREDWRPDPNERVGVFGVVLGKAEERSPEAAPGAASDLEMGLAAGGLIHEGLQGAGQASDYDEANSLRVFVHLLNAEESEYVLGKKLPREDEWP